MTLDETLAGKEIPEDIKKDLLLVTIPYLSFDNAVQQGHLVVHANVAEEVQNIFKKLSEIRFPIARIIPTHVYEWDDNASMAANNTSAFNYRVIFGTNRLSNHSYGRAIDINPMQNPYTQHNGVIVPSGARHDPTQQGTITVEIASLFKSFGWQWGGDWQERKDWQHFEKP